MRTKRKKQKQKVFYIISVIIIILFMVTGYSLFSESLNIFGSANTNEIFGDKLKIDLIPVGTQYTEYANNGLPPNIIFQNEILDGNELTINFVRADDKATKYRADLKVDYVNAYLQNMTKIAISVEIVSGENFLNQRATKINARLTPGQQGSFTVIFRNNNSSDIPMQLRATLSSITAGVEQYFYYNININL